MSQNDNVVTSEALGGASKLGFVYTKSLDQLFCLGLGTVLAIELAYFAGLGLLVSFDLVQPFACTLLIIVILGNAEGRAFVTAPILPPVGPAPTLGLTLIMILLLYVVITVLLIALYFVPGYLHFGPEFSDLFLNDGVQAALDEALRSEDGWLIWVWLSNFGLNWWPAGDSFESDFAYILCGMPLTFLTLLISIKFLFAKLTLKGWRPSRITLACGGVYALCHIADGLAVVPISIATAAIVLWFYRRSGRFLCAVVAYWLSFIDPLLLYFDTSIV